MKYHDKLSVKWSKKENELQVYLPLGYQTNCDGHYIFSNVFSKEFIVQMKSGDYDITTLKFLIEPKKNSYIYRFRSTRPNPPDPSWVEGSWGPSTPS